MGPLNQVVMNEQDNMNNNAPQILECAPQSNKHPEMIMESTANKTFSERSSYWLN